MTMMMMMMMVIIREWLCEVDFTYRGSHLTACTVNAFKAQFDKFWSYQAVKYEFTADLAGTGNRSEEVIK